MMSNKWVKPPGARGTAAMDPETRKKVARMGGLTISKNRKHMSELGKRGGKSISKDRKHMARIGRIGGGTPRKSVLEGDPTK